MPRVQRVSDVIEIISEKAFYYYVGGLTLSVASGFLIAYRGQTGMFVPLAVIFGVIGFGCLCYATYVALQTKKVTRKPVTCPFCANVNELVGDPDSDFSCVSCHRMIPIKDGEVLGVQQVRCGFCNELNYYSEKTQALLCENCNHEIPIALDDTAPRKSIPLGFAVVDDEALYELILIGGGSKEEELIQTLQSMLALNRNQVKQMLNELPVTLLTGINRRKAEMLKAQLSIHDGQVEYRQMEEVRY